MKQDIICKKCEAEKRARHGIRLSQSTFEPYPGEFMKFVHGKARQDYLCDSCGERTVLKKGTEVCAFSLWTNRNPYFEWESNFIEINMATLD